MKYFIFLSLSTILFSCKTKKIDAIFEKLDPSSTNVNFTNQLTENEENNVLNYEYFYNGGGVAAADFNNDGLVDLFFTGNQVPNKLYVNKGRLQFEDVTAKAFATEQNSHSWHTGVTIVDINQDGWQDIYVAVSANINNPQLRKNKLFVNNKNLSFTERAHDFGLDIGSYTTQSAFFDFDKDGDLDAYILNHNVKDFKRFDVQAVHYMRDSLAGDLLLENIAEKPAPGKEYQPKYVDISTKAGIKGNPIGFGLGVHIADLNQDNWPDIYISNDYLEEDYLYINNKNGSFTDEVKTRTNHISYFSMGNEIADINNDMLPDIISTDMLPEDNKRQKLLFGPDKYEAYLSMLKGGIHPSFMRNMLQLNNGNGSFAEIGQLAGISNTDWTWAILAADFDNDGYKDLFMSNGYLRDYTNMDFMKYYADASLQEGIKVSSMIEKMPTTKTSNYIFRNNGNLTFENKQKEWGFDDTVISNGAITADLDNDGDLEIITNNLQEPASIYKNLTSEKSKKNYLDILLPPNSKYGAKVSLYAGNSTQYQEFTPTHGFQSSAMGAMHFGLANVQTVDSIQVLWPDHSQQTLYKIDANQRLKIEKKANATAASKAQGLQMFQPEKFDYGHEQLALNDFAKQLLLPQMYSYAGPRIAKGDVNGDKLDDFYLGGGKGQAGQLFLQTKAGSFVKKQTTDFDNEKICTDTDALFFDLESDGDLDLLVLSGGYEYLEHDLALQNRIYTNDGKGNFKRNFYALDEQGYADHVAKAIDFDKDGDQDLIIGGGCKPQQYPDFNPSRLFRNDKGKLSKVDMPAFEQLGLINDLAIVDFNSDGYDDIVSVGEWTSVQFWANKRGKFEKIDTNLPDITGLWNRIISFDLENDGDKDFIIGNYGLNSQWKASETEPVKLFHADFDNNGTVDPILSYYIQGKSYPAYSRDELLEQLAPLKKKYTNYESFSSALMDDILAEFKEKTPSVLEANQLKTIMLVNNGGHYQLKELPVQAQFAPVFAMLSSDLNHDGYVDVILAGNQSHARVRTGNLDANFGQVFINNKKGGFEYLPQSLSGLDLRGDIKDLQLINNKLVAAANNAKVKLYKMANYPKTK